MEKNREYYEGLDKRSKEYKLWKASEVDLVVPTQADLEAKHDKLSKGLGDTVAKAMKYTGIKQVVEAFTPEGEDCGCDKRKDKLNKLFKYKMPLCLNVEEYNTLNDILNREHIVKMIQVRQSEQAPLLKVYNRIFNVKKPATSCNDCMRSVVTELKQVFNTYK
jgi:hypothetical protein